MISRIIKDNNINQLRTLLMQSDKIVITCHLSPDGDAIGSSLGLWHVLNRIGKTAKVITPDAVPKHLSFLPGIKDVLPFNRYGEFATRLFNEADLVFCLDFNDAKRVDKMSETLLASPARKVMIDHHLFPGDFADVVISHPEVSSTCMLLFRVLCRLELFDDIDRKAAECIYTGMMTDTGNFTYNSCDPDLYVVIAELVKKGIDKDLIYRKACNTSSLSRLQLNSYAVLDKMHLFADHAMALITLDRSELNRFHYEKGDTESLVNVPLSLPEITWSVFLRDDVDYIKVSMRSKGEFPVNKVCEEHFNGGGHKNAAGGEFYGSMAQAVETLKSVMPEYDKYINLKQNSDK